MGRFRTQSHVHSHPYTFFLVTVAAKLGNKEDSILIFCRKHTDFGKKGSRRLLGGDLPELLIFKSNFSVIVALMALFTKFLLYFVSKKRWC